MANIKIGNRTYNNISIIKVKDADNPGEYLEYILKTSDTSAEDEVILDLTDEIAETGETPEVIGYININSEYNNRLLMINRNSLVNLYPDINIEEVEVTWYDRDTATVLSNGWYFGGSGEAIIYSSVIGYLYKFIDKYFITVDLFGYQTAVNNE